jgi:uncharacterized membrane protein YhaH (DUF805 family)
MSFNESIKSGFKNYIKFSGRASRSEFWWWALFTYLIGILGQEVDYLINGYYPYCNYILSILLFFPCLTMYVRRAHDSGRSGWWILCPVYHFLLLFFPSTEGENKYGELKN